MSGLSVTAGRKAFPFFWKSRKTVREEVSMGGKTSAQTPKADIRSWLIVIGIAALFFIWGLFIYSSVGDKEPPDWDFGAVQDIPGESPYSTSSPKGFPGLTPPATQEETPVARQHVMGRSEDSKPTLPEPTPTGGAQ